MIRPLLLAAVLSLSSTVAYAQTDSTSNAGTEAVPNPANTNDAPDLTPPVEGNDTGTSNLAVPPETAGDAFRDNSNSQQLQNSAAVERQQNAIPDRINDSSQREPLSPTPTAENQQQFDASRQQDRNSNQSASIENNRDSNRWRFKQHNGEWWYWKPDNTWVIWRDGSWIAYDRATYRSPVRYAPPVTSYNYGYQTYQQPSRVYYNDGYRRSYPINQRYGVGYGSPYYRDGYGGGYRGAYPYGGYGYGGYNRGFYGGSREGRIGAGIGGAIGGPRGAALGRAIGEISD